MIYKALLKYKFNNFTLDILEYCDTNKQILLQREQYYLDLLKPQYNIMKNAGSTLGFKHSKTTIEHMKLSRTGKTHTDYTKLLILAKSLTAQSVLLINTKTNETKVFMSIRKAASFVGIHHSYIAKCLQKKNIYKGEVYTITRIKK